MPLSIGIADRDIPQADIFLNRSSAFEALLVSFPEAEDISSWTFTLSVATEAGVVVFTAVDADGLSVDTTENTVSLDVSAPDVAALDEDTYLYDLRLERTGENDLWLIRGYIYVQDAVTVT